YMQNDFKKKLAGRNNGADIPLAVIDMRAYGMMDGAAVVTQAYELMGK
ncbi:PTS sugar transporter subunit IIB, partial [Enterococcus cecorum]|nr:PTS sugar transporter subunit IIB [Enterococcus cecorum]